MATNYHVLRVKYLGPTNHRGSRVKITSDRFNQSLTIPFDYALNNCEDMAVVALEGRGFHIVGVADGYVITDTFEPLRLIEYTIQGNYGHGWEDVTTETSHKEARERLKEYRENEPQYAHREIRRITR